MPRQYTTRRERKRLWCAFFLLLALAAFLLWQELSPWEKAPAPNPPAAGLTLRVIDVGQAQSLLLTCGEDAPFWSMPENMPRAARYWPPFPAPG